MPQHHQALYKFSSAVKNYTNLVRTMPQRCQALYKNSLEEHHAGVIQCARVQQPFQDPSQDQIKVYVELPGVIWGLYGIRKFEISLILT